MTRRSIRCLTLFAALAAIFLASAMMAGGAFAYSLENRDEPVTEQIAVSPYETDVTMQPGQSTVRQVTVVNRAGVTLSVEFIVVDFEGSIDPADTHVLLGEGEDSSWGARSWIEPELEEIDLKQGDTLKFDVKITVPDDAEAGGHYAAVMVKEKPGEGSIQMSAQATSLFLVTVPGPVDNRATLDEPETPLLASFGPVNIGLVFNNLGNIHQSPSGTVRITNVLGQEVAELPVEQWIVLPESSRRTLVEWPGRWHLGPYKIDAQVSYGENGETLYASSTIWFIPWEIILIGLAAGFIILFLISLLTRRRRRKSREMRDELEELRAQQETGEGGREPEALYEEEAGEEVIAAAAATEEPGTGAVERPSISADLVPLNQLLPSIDDTSLVDISDPETRQLIRELIGNEMDLARMYIIEGKNEEARQELLEARSAAMRIKLFTEVTLIDDLLNYL